MKRTIYAIILAVVVLFTSCQHDEKIFSPQEPDVPEGYINIRFKIDQTDMTDVDVRSVDPDGQDINNMSLFCFNAYGLFLAAADGVTLTPDAAAEGGHSTSGEYDAQIPQETAVIHFIANQNSALYTEKDFVNQTEAQVLAAMEGASGMMIYWRRFAMENGQGTIQEQLAALDEGIKLIRNQAKVTITDWESTFKDGGTFTVTGYVTTNIHAFGTVAPFCSEHGFAIYEWPVSDGHYSVTLPENKTMMSDITDINTKSEDYIFEHENTLDNPVSVIIKGKHNGQDKDLYYRAMIMNNDTGEMIPILRNHHYKLNIVGPLSYGQETFEAALNGPATNNVWVSVDSWVKEVADSDYKLTLEETSKVFHADKAGTAYTFNYTLTLAANSTVTTLTAPEVSWLDGNNVARHEFVHTFDPATGKGTISITLLEDNPDTPSQSGTLMIRKGRLYRTIDLSMISTQEFTPSWVAAQVYGGTTGEFVTLKFTIPETCPESLFPFPVMISVNDLDVRSGSGMTLPVRLADEASWYGEPNDIGYKYEYVVNEPGVHRLYFHSILPHGNNETELITIEANFFEKLEKYVVFADHQREILLYGLNLYQSSGDDGFAADESVKYLLVPQKINAPVTFTMELQDGGQYVNAGPNDEFLIYSKTLNYYEDNDVSEEMKNQFDCYFQPVDETHWSSNGRVHMFYPRPEKNPTEPGRYSIYLYTNSSNNRDVVRIASNTSLSSAYLEANNDDGRYKGYSYRSVIFELANHRAFRFAAQVDDKGDYQLTSSLEEEKIDTLYWDYAAPGVSKDISFDITSFKGADDRSVDPFGTEFEVYIDAPMLEIDTERLDDLGLTTDKLKEDPNVEGRFIYTVNADREAERSNNGSTVLIQDMLKANQTGERKVLPFKTREVTNSGEIKISSNKEKVVFYDKTFKVLNKPISGTIKYGDTEANAEEVPANAFVAFIRTKTNTRIGAINVTSTGKYELNLRAEYSFDWKDDVILNYKVGTTVYECKTILSELAASSNVVLTKLTQ